MVTAEQIEAMEVSTNDVADLSRRLSNAIEMLESIAAETWGLPSPLSAGDAAVMMKKKAQLGLSLATGEHREDCDGNVEIIKNGRYYCMCNLHKPCEMKSAL